MQTTYGKFLPEAAKEDLGRLYYARVYRVGASSSTRGFRKILDAVTKTRTAGFSLKSLPGANVALVEVTSKTLLKEGQIEFPTAIDMDLPFTANKSNIDKAFTGATAKNADILVLIDVAVARTLRDVHTNERVPSEFQIGTRKVPNPDYNMAQNELNQTMFALQQANMQKISADSEYCYGLGCLAKAIGQIAAASAVGKARRTQEEAMATLAATPMQIDEPVYRQYEFNKTTMVSTKVATVNYYVVDRLGKVYFKDVFDVRDEKEFLVAYKLHARDKDRETNLSGTQTEEDVAAFESEEGEVKLSSILEQFTAKSAKLRPLPSLTSIRTEILKDKNTALTAYRSRKFDVKPRKDDDRFNRVVVVHNPQGGLGTGFYIRDDLVLTYFHVIEGAKFIDLKLFNGTETFGKVIAKDVRLDLAVIRVQARGKPVRFFTEQTLPLGSPVDVIGHPNRLQFTITRGVIGALRNIRSLYMEGGKPVRLIQTDAAINGGNSGGPLFMGDKVIGVNTWKIVATQFEGLNFAVHYSEVLEFLKRKGINIHTES